jgi:hypothetical protein
MTENFHRRSAPIRVIDLPGFRRIEDMSLLISDILGPRTPEFDDVWDALVESTFHSPRHAMDDVIAEHGDALDTPDMTDDEQVELLGEFGLDLTDGRGHPLRITRLLAPYAEAVVRGLVGRIPDRGEVGLERWEAALASDARAFKRVRGG